MLVHIHRVYQLRKSLETHIAHIKAESRTPKAVILELEQEIFEIDTKFPELATYEPMPVWGPGEDTFEVDGVFLPRGAAKEFYIRSLSQQVLDGALKGMTEVFPPVKGLDFPSRDGDQTLAITEHAFQMACQSFKDAVAARFRWAVWLKLFK